MANHTPRLNGELKSSLNARQVKSHEPKKRKENAKTPEEYVGGVDHRSRSCSSK